MITGFNSNSSISKSYDRNKEAVLLTCFDHNSSHISEFELSPVIIARSSFVDKAVGALFKNVRFPSP